MKENQVSRTALMAAYLRSYHSIHDTPKIFNDFLAGQLLKAEERQFFQDYYQTLLKNSNMVSANGQGISLAKVMQVMTAASLILSRSRYAEDTLEEAVRHGVKQYVILGAGMDTFAFRRPEMLEQIEVFEVDHPDTQIVKRQRIAELGWECSGMTFRLASLTDIGSIMELIKSCIKDMESTEIFQWDEYYPGTDIFEKDIQNRSLYMSALKHFLDTDFFYNQKCQDETKPH